MPDRPPLADLPSTGKNRKLKVLSKKHLRDKLRQEIKELTKMANWLIFDSSWSKPEWTLKRLEKSADRADGYLEKLSRED